MSGKVKKHSLEWRVRWSGCNASTVFGLLTLLASPASAQEVRTMRWDGTSITGTWIGSTDGVHIEIAKPDGVISEAVEDLWYVDFSAAVRAPSGPVAMHLSDGGRLFGQWTSGVSESVQFKSAIGDHAVGWDKLAALRLAEPSQFKRAQKLFEDALGARSPSQDVLVSRDQADVKVLQGRIESLDQRGGSFLFAGESRKFQNEKIYAIVFAAGALPPAPAAVTFELADGSSVSGALGNADNTVVRAATSFGDARMAVTDVRRIRFRGDRIQYLDELKPSTERSEGVLHAPWPTRPNASVLGGPLSIAGRSFERGLGTHSRTELTYPLRGEYERFAATIGIDDAVRPLGHVVMRVHGDGRTLFDSGPVSGVDPPRDVLIDVAGIANLTLLVDYGDGLDASDHADWGDARLLRPRKAASGTR